MWNVNLGGSDIASIQAEVVISEGVEQLNGIILTNAEGWTFFVPCEENHNGCKEIVVEFSKKKFLNTMGTVASFLPRSKAQVYFFKTEHPSHSVPFRGVFKGMVFLTFLNTSGDPILKTVSLRPESYETFFSRHFQKVLKRHNVRVSTPM